MKKDKIKPMLFSVIKQYSAISETDPIDEKPESMNESALVSRGGKSPEKRSVMLFAASEASE